jgi:hypothetical protein
MVVRRADGGPPPCVGWDHARMVEYGNGVGEVTGVANGAGGGSGGGPIDVGAAAGNFIHDAANTVSTLPPEALIAIAIVIFLGLIFLRKAF